MLAYSNSSFVVESFYDGPPSDDNEDNDDIGVYKPRPEGITVDSLNSLTSDTSRSTATNSYLQWKSPALGPPDNLLGDRGTQYTASPSCESPNFGDISESSTTPTHNIMTRQLPLSSTPAGGRSVPLTRSLGDALPSFPSSPCDVEDGPHDRDNERRSVSFQTSVAGANDGGTNWSEFLSSKLKEMAAERFSRSDGNNAEPGASFLSTQFMPQPIGFDTAGLQKLSTNVTATVEPIRFGSSMVAENANNESVIASQPTLLTGVAPLQDESRERSECIASASDASATNPTDLSEYTISGESDVPSQNQAPVLKSPPTCDLTQYSIKSDSSDEHRSRALLNPDDVNRGKEPASQGPTCDLTQYSIKSDSSDEQSNHTPLNPDDVRRETDPGSQGIVFGCSMTNEGGMLPPPLSVKQAAFAPKLPPLSTEKVLPVIEAPPAGYWLEPTVRLPDNSSTVSTAHESSERSLELTQERFFAAVSRSTMFAMILCVSMHGGMF